MRIRLQGPGHAAGLLMELNHCRQSRRYCDIFLQVGNRTFAAHRVVLACAGTYFRNLFSQAVASPTTAFSLEFISPANLEKVLNFVYTGEILTDLIDVGVLYELAKRLGINDLVGACHATFPALQASVSAECKAGHVSEDSSMVSAASAAAASASSVCSSPTFCSSLSSSASPTPAAAPFPLFQDGAARTDRQSHGGAPSLAVKSEEVQSNDGYGQTAADHQAAEGLGLLISSQWRQSDCLLPTPAVLQPKMECRLDDDTDGKGRICGGHTVQSDSCSFPDSSAQLTADTCNHTSSSAEAVGGLQVASVRVGSVERSMADVQRGSRLAFGQLEKEPNEGKGAGEGTEEEQWRQLGDDIIELSDDENFLEEGNEEDDENGLVRLENGGGGVSGSQVSRTTPSCRACSLPPLADLATITRHAKNHLTDRGLCRLCGASFPDHAAGLTHSLTHMGVQLFTCDMCHLQFCSHNKLLHHLHQTASSYTPPQGVLTSPSQDMTAELECAACTQTLSKDFQTVRDHILSHVCPQSLSCLVCQLPQLSLCALLWHALTHLSLPVFTCPHCTRCFTEHPLLVRHMTAHAEELAGEDRRLQVCGAGGQEEFFCSSLDFQSHLILHSSDGLGPDEAAGGPSCLKKRKSEQSLDCPPSSCSSSSPAEVGSLVKMSNLGLGLGGGFGIPGKLFPPMIPRLTKGSTGQDGVGGAPGVRGKWYRCRYCGKRFAHSGEFTYHLRIHTGEKPYQCKVCHRFFRGRSTMICHLKTHAGALMYHCPICGLYFSTLKLVSTHMELHKDQLPPDFTIEQTFMYNDHSKEPLPT